MQIELYVDGKPLKKFAHNNEVFVAVPESGNYEIELINEENCKIEAVLSVDGVNVINGENATYRTPGYVLEGYSKARIKGFLRNGKEAAAFTLVPQDESYSVQMGVGTGKTNNGKVIGVAVFYENRSRGATNLSQVRRSASPDPRGTSFTKGGGRYGSSGGVLSVPVSGSANSSVESTTRGMVVNDSSVIDVGTGYGEVVEMNTSTIRFERSSTRPRQEITIRYATKALLGSWGIQVPRVPDAPKAFADSPSVPAPPGWVG